MPKRSDYDDFVISESGNWNVADKYSKFKIMKPLALADYYADVAAYGYEDLVEELQNYNVPRDLIRYKALERLIDVLIRLVNNAKFALKAPGTKAKALEYKEQLKKFKDKIPALIKVTRNNLNGSATIKIINENIFSKILWTVEEIQSKLNEPLNKNHLIFTDKEEFDPLAAKKKFMEDAMSRG